MGFAWAGEAVPASPLAEGLHSSPGLAGQPDHFFLHPFFAPWAAAFIAALLTGLALWVSCIRKLNRREQRLTVHCRQLTESLERMERLVQVRSDAMLRMGHDLRSPLTSIVGYAQMMRSDPDPDLRTRGTLVIERTAQRMVGLINEMLVLGHSPWLVPGIDEVPDPLRQPRRVQPLVPGRFFQELSEEVQPLVQSGQNDWRMSLAPDLPALVITDGAALWRVLVNLLSNAAASVQKGCISLEVGWLAADGAGSAGRLRLVVQDTGPGLPPSVRQHHFPDQNPVPTSEAGEPHSASGPVPASASGAGLGLVSARLLLAQLGGAIDYRPVPTSGSCFVLTVPAGEAVEEGGSQAALSAVPVEAGCGVVTPLSTQQRAWLEQHMAIGARTDLLHWLDGAQHDAPVPPSDAAHMRQWIERGDFDGLKRWLSGAGQLK